MSPHILARNAAIMSACPYLRPPSVLCLLKCLRYVGALHLMMNVIAESCLQVSPPTISRLHLLAANVLLGCLAALEVPVCEVLTLNLDHPPSRCLIPKYQISIGLSTGD